MPVLISQPREPTEEDDAVAGSSTAADAAELEEQERDRMDAVAGSSAERTTAEERGERDKMQIYEVNAGVGVSW
ncbi:hypothetical protein HHUSO_G19748 [Huso huso]|uniref:Uncharacterized protein n=1 Tax=Huso huso TaxID=61971 RepID=A0ABR0Z2P3_HUSHU